MSASEIDRLCLCGGPVLDTYRERRGGGRALCGEAVLSGRTLRLSLTRWRFGATSGLALRHNGLELLQLLIFHQELVLHFHLHDINAPALHTERQQG